MSIEQKESRFVHGTKKFRFVYGTKIILICPLTKRILIYQWNKQNPDLSLEKSASYFIHLEQT